MVNKDEILKLKPGRELDALVAEKVMGWVLIGKLYGDHPIYKERARLFSPSLNIVDAWRVEEVIWKRKKHYEYVSELIGVVAVNAGGESMHLLSFRLVHALPAQRCKAALLAVMEEEQ